MFEASLFNISVVWEPSEVESMDPQQRLLLESVVDRDEKTGKDGVDRSIHRGMHTGVMVGAWNSQYELGSKSVGQYSSVGGMQSVLCGRVSYTFNLQGPSVTVDTACSASLVAAHQSFQAIKDGACDIVITAGVSMSIGNLFAQTYLLRGWQATTGDARPSMRLLMDTAVVSAVE